MRVTGELIFSTSLQGKRVVRVPEPSAIITEATLDTAAGRVITANPFDATIGNLVALIRADRVAVSRTVII